MTELPRLAPVDGMGLVIDGHLRLMGAIAIAASVAAFGVLLWAIQRSRRRRAALRCPLDGRPAEVEFTLGPDGTPTDVARCSLHGRRTPACDKRCLEAAA